jgi:hypothetical protein
MPAVDQHPLGSPATMLDFHRRGLLSIAYGTACRARRARHIEQLDAARRIGAQLDAVDVGSPEARDVIQAARDAIHTVADQLDDLGA